MFSSRLLSCNVAFSVLYLFSEAFSHSAAQYACPNGSGGALNVASVVVVKQTIHIMTSIPQDTTFEVNRDLTVTINNAPTDLDMVTTYYYRSTIAQATNYQATMGVTRYTKGAFTLVIVAPKMSAKRRRQAGSFVGYNGRATSSCSQASFLSLINGGLYITFANGTTAQYSANTGDAYDYFIPSVTPGNITTTFSLSHTDTLLWSNDSFFNGGALFCVLPSGIIVAVLQPGAQPTSCVFIDLTVAELTSCVDPSPVSGMSGALGGGTVVLQGDLGPSGPVGPQGSIGPSGPQGPSGLPGQSGAPGPSGIQGIQGVQGVTGASGLPGPSGAQGIQGVQGIPGSSGAQGVTGASGLPGPSGAQGIQGVQGTPGPSGAQGAQGVQGNPGPSGAQGIQGVQGPSGAPGVTGASGLPGPSGAQGATGVQGIPGLSGAQGVTGASGLPGPSGAQGIQGVQGNPGPSGAQGVQGSIGLQGIQGIQGSVGPSGAIGPTGLQGPIGPSGAPGIAYAYLSCFYQSGSSTSTSNKVLTNFQKTYTIGANAGCSSLCNSQNFNYYGVVNGATGGTGVDCYCGDTLNFVTILNLGSGMAPDNNCGLCTGGPVSAGVCGVSTSNTVAIFARAF